jgi:hypothetical protein
MQVFLLGYIVICICEIFTVGGIPGIDESRHKVIVGWTAVHIATISATFWVLLLNAVVGYQFLDDGTPTSIGLVIGSAAAFFIGTGYVALDTGLDWTGFFQSSVTDAPNINHGLYVLYLLIPLICLAFFFVLETYLVLKDLGEVRPMSKFPLCSISLTFQFSLRPLSCPLLSQWCLISQSQSRYATALTERLTELCSRRCLCSSLSCYYGGSGTTLPRTIGQQASITHLYWRSTAYKG